LSKSSLRSLRNTKVHYRVHKSTPPDPILSQPNPVRSIDTYIPMAHLNVILPLCLGLPNGLLPSGLSPAMRGTCPTHLIRQTYALILDQKEFKSNYKDFNRWLEKRKIKIEKLY